MNIDIKRLVSVGWADPQTDVVPVATISVGKVLQDSFIPSVKKKDYVDMKSDDVDGTAKVLEGSYNITLAFTLLGLSFEDMAYLQGGTISNGTYTSAMSETYKSVRLTFENVDGQFFRWELPNCRVVTSQSGVKGKAGTFGLNVALRVLGYDYKMKYNTSGQTLGVDGINLGINGITLGI